jgi:hypothetical protein
MDSQPAPPTPAASAATAEEATPTDKGLLETQESVPQPTRSGQKPNRPPPQPPASPAGSKPSRSKKQPSVPSRRPPSRPAPTPTPTVAPVVSKTAGAGGDSAEVVAEGSVSSAQLSALQSRLERLAQAPAVAEAEEEEGAEGPLTDEELTTLVDRIADLINLRASLEQHAPLLSAWRSSFLESGRADVLSVLQQARAVSELVQAPAFELMENVTTMVRLSDGMESDRLFLHQLRRKYLADNLTL